MKFYVVSDAHGATVGCERSLRKAQRYGRELCGRGWYSIQLVVITGNMAEAVRRLLGDLGGYADDSREVQPLELDPPAPKSGASL